MHDTWLALLLFLGLSLSVPLGLLLVARIVRVRARQTSPLIGTTYECGEDTAGPSWIQFHPRYYALALFFVLFDVEAAFMLPWGVAVREVGVGEMLVFVLILMVGWGYVVRKGTLKWQ